MREVGECLNMFAEWFVTEWWHRLKELDGEGLRDTIEQLLPAVTLILEQPPRLPSSSSSSSVVAFELTQAVLEKGEMAVLMEQDLCDAWAALVSHIAAQGVDAVTQQACQLAAGDVAACAMDLGLARVVSDITSLLELSEVDALTTQLGMLMGQMVGHSGMREHKELALLQLNYKAMAMLREQGEYTTRSREEEKL